VILRLTQESPGFSRGEDVKMFPVLKAAIAAKRSAAVEEAPFRQLLAAQLSFTTDGADIVLGKA
jgi:hypothetical protein